MSSMNALSTLIENENREMRKLSMKSSAPAYCRNLKTSLPRQLQTYYYWLCLPVQKAMSKSCNGANISCVASFAFVLTTELHVIRRFKRFCTILSHIVEHCDRTITKTHSRRGPPVSTTIPPFPPLL